MDEEGFQKKAGSKKVSVETSRQNHLPGHDPVDSAGLR